jgi:hypothetical protein
MKGSKVNKDHNSDGEEDEVKEENKQVVPAQQQLT